MMKKMDMISFVKILVDITKETKGGMNFNTLTRIQILRFMGELYESDLVDSVVKGQL